MQDAYKKEIKKIFGTSDLEELRMIAKQKKNPRNAGKKRRFSEEQVVWMAAMRESGKTIQEIADAYQTSRQTVYKSIARMEDFSDLPDYAMKLYYMSGQQLCSKICVDFLREKVVVKNYTDKIPLTAFGIVENPTWKDFQDFLEYRCLPRTRANIKEALREMNVTSYDPLQIITRTKGRIEGDNQWIQMVCRKPGKEAAYGED